MSVIELESIGEKRSYASTVLPGLILGPAVFTYRALTDYLKHAVDPWTLIA